MKNKTIATIAALCLLTAAASAAPAKECCPPAATPTAPTGHIRFSSLLSEDLSGVKIDGLIGVWTPPSADAFLFLDTGFHYEDNGQSITNLGIGFRKMVPGQEIIFGANIFWDHINSEHDNDIDQLGFGLEVLTHWVDARFNYYVPEDDQFSISGRTKSSTSSRRTPGGVLRTTTTTGFNQIETGLEGFNAEIGFLIPGSEQFAETRIFGGYYHYDNPFGPDFDGFKARIEAHLLQGVTVGAEYWDDESLMGGHWTAEVAVSVPFEIGKLFAGQNPFEGASESFKRTPRRFEDRLSERIERSHRVQTTTSGDIQARSTTTQRFTPLAPPKRQGGAAPAGGGFPIE